MIAEYILCLAEVLEICNALTARKFWILFQVANHAAQKFDVDFFPAGGVVPALMTFLTLPFRLSLVIATGIEDFEEIEDPGDLLLIDWWVGWDKHGLLTIRVGILDTAELGRNRWPPSSFSLTSPRWHFSSFSLMFKWVVLSWMAFLSEHGFTFSFEEIRVAWCSWGRKLQSIVLLVTKAEEEWGFAGIWQCEESQPLCSVEFLSGEDGSLEIGEIQLEIFSRWFLDLSLVAECDVPWLGIPLEAGYRARGRESRGIKDSLREAASGWPFFSRILSFAFVPSSWISCSLSLKRSCSFSWDKARYLEARRELFSSISKVESWESNV